MKSLLCLLVNKICIDIGTAGFMDRYRSVLDLNVTAALVCTREAIQLMTADDARASGHIILMNRWVSVLQIGTIYDHNNDNTDCLNGGSLS